jgi:hypothetical protein
MLIPSSVANPLPSHSPIPPPSNQIQVLADGAGLPLLFPLRDLGMSYEPSAPESLEGMLDSPGSDVSSKGGEGLGVLSLVRVGARLPHVALGLEGHAISSVDLPDQLMTAAARAAGEGSGAGEGVLGGPVAVLIVRAGGVSEHRLKTVTWEGAEVPVVVVEGADAQEPQVGSLCIRSCSAAPLTCACADGTGISDGPSILWLTSHPLWPGPRGELQDGGRVACG